MGRAIIRSPSVFLMDEPLSNLDAQLRVQMRADVAGLQARIGMTTVYVTHDQAEAMTLGHRGRRASRRVASSSVRAPASCTTGRSTPSSGLHRVAGDEPRDVSLGTNGERSISGTPLSP